MQKDTRMNARVTAIATTWLLGALSLEAAAAQPSPPPSTPGAGFTASYNDDGAVSRYTGEAAPPPAAFSRNAYTIAFPVRFAARPHCTVESDGGGYKFYLVPRSLTVSGVTVRVGAMEGAMGLNTRAPFTLTCQLL
jgi:hypothetical protein